MKDKMWDFLEKGQSSGDVSINCLKYIKEQVDDVLDDLEEYIK